jgi:hypothetical protein
MIEKKSISCHDVMQHICKNLGTELESEKCREIKEHLESCSHCQEYFKSVEITIDCYRKYNVELPPDAHKRLIDFLGLEE